MNAAEFRCTVESCGLTPTTLAIYLGVVIKSVNRWFLGEGPIPDVMIDWVIKLQRLTRDTVAELVESHRDAQVIYTYRRPAHMYKAHPEWRRLPASWHHVVVARVREQLPHLRIDYY